MDVSVIIPVYNNDKYIELCIESLINQKTKLKYEIIAVNDGSTDNSLAILNKFKDKIIIIDKKNTGPGDTRNVGIKRAKGKYFMFVDSDDYVASNFIDKMHDVIVKEDADVVICDFNRVQRNGDITYMNKGKAGIYYKGKINEVLLMAFHSCNKIFKREVLGGLKYPKGMFFEDVVFISKVLLNANKIVKINDPLYYYRDNQNGTTNVIDITNYDLSKALDMIEKPFLDNGYINEIEFLYVDNILVDLLIKVVKSNIKNKKDIFKDIKDSVILKYPNWYKNKYLKRCKLTKRLYLLCLRFNLYALIDLMF